MSAYGSRLDLQNYNTLRDQTFYPHLNPSAPSAIFANLAELSLRRFFVTPKLIRAILNATRPTLVSLDLYKCQLGNSDVLHFGPFLTHLLHLDLGGNRDLTDVSLVSIASTCTKLQYLVRQAPIYLR